MEEPFSSGGEHLSIKTRSQILKPNVGYTPVADCSLNLSQELYVPDECVAPKSSVKPTRIDMRSNNQ